MLTLYPLSQRKNTIYPIIVSHLCVAFVAYIIAMSTLNTGARYFAMMLLPSVCSKIVPTSSLTAPHTWKNTD